MITPEELRYLDVDGRIARARKVLEMEPPADLDISEYHYWNARQTGRLQYHLEDLAALLEKVTQ